MGDMMVMQDSMAANGDIEQSADLGDCCNDAAAFVLAGKLCKTGQKCQVPTDCLLPLLQAVAEFVPSSVPLVTGSPTPLDGAPASVWRPPVRSDSVDPNCALPPRQSRIP